MTALDEWAAEALDEPEDVDERTVLEVIVGCAVLEVFRVWGPRFSEVLEVLQVLGF